MKMKRGIRALPVLLAVLLVSVVMVPAVTAVSEVKVQRPIPANTNDLQASPDLSFVISENVKKVTPHWVLFAADEKGKTNAINDLREISITDKEKLKLIEDLQAIWKKYPVVTKYRDGVTEVTFDHSGEFALTEEENFTLAQVDEILSEYLNDKIMAGSNTRWYAAPCHQDMIEISCLKWGVPSTYATYAHNAADDPDSWPTVWPPTGLEWLDNFIQTICHSYDHYYNPLLRIGNAPSQCENYADTAMNWYDQSSMYNAYTNLGYSSHFLTDVGNPFHTGMELDQAQNPWVHFDYEEYVYDNWAQGYNYMSVFENNGYYYTITSPSSSTKSLAGYAKQYDETLYYLVYNHRYTFGTDSDVKSITENCLLDTAKYTLGLVKYVRD